MKKIYALTQGLNQPSARFRWGQYQDDLIMRKFDVKNLHAKYEAYPPEKSKIEKSSWLIKALFDSSRRVKEVNKYADICFLQRHLISTLITFECKIKKPILFDIDDAIFLNDRFHSSEKIARKSEVTICGNKFLANHYEKFTRKIEILPTAVDVDKFSLKQYIEKEFLNIGWSGSSSGYKFLYSIEDSIFNILKKYDNLRFVIISDKAPNFKKIPDDKVKFIRWNALNEVEQLQEIDIGLMPLFDDIWCRGKCSYKMLTYMAIGIPVIASPIGMNIEVFEKGVFGLKAELDSDWGEAIEYFVENINEMQNLGLEGRRIIEKFYSKDIILRKMIDIIKNI